MIGRRSFFAKLFGASSAAALADLPEPEKVEALKAGAIYALTYDEPMSCAQWAGLQRALAERT